MSLPETIQWCETHEASVAPGYERHYSAEACRLVTLTVAGPDDLVIRREDAWDKTYELQRSFNPPADMSINEKQAWKEGLYHALDFIREALAAAEGGEE